MTSIQNKIIKEKNSIRKNWYEVEMVLDHEYCSNEYYFLIKWKGYDE